MTEPLVLSLSAASLVLGREWFPLIGARADRWGMRLARRHRSKHIVLAGKTAGSVGLLAMKPGRSQKKELYSAAQNVAARFEEGNFAFCWRLNGLGTGCWQFTGGGGWHVLTAFFCHAK